MNNHENANLLNNSGKLVPISTQFTTQTILHGQMSSEQIDREQDIKVLEIAAAAGTAIGITWLLCSVFKDK